MRDIFTIFGIICLAATLTILLLVLDKDDDEVLRIRMRDACLPGMVERVESYSDGMHMIICTDGERHWVESVQK